MNTIKENVKLLEFSRTLIMFVGRMLRGFLIPYFLGSSKYAIYLRIVALYRFSNLFEFGIRQWAIELYKNSSDKSIPIFRIIWINLLISLPALLIGFIMDFNIIQTICVYLFWCSYNLKYILSQILPYSKRWQDLFKIELLTFLVLFIGIVIFYYLSNIYTLLILDISISILIICFFIYKIKNQKISNFSFKFDISHKLKTLQEFIVGNGDSLFLLLISDAIRPIFGLSFAFSGLFLYLTEYTSNRFVVSNKSLRYTSKVYLLTSLAFIISYIILFNGPVQYFYEWAEFNLLIPIALGFNLFFKLSYSLLRKEDLIGEKNSSDLKSRRNLTVIFNIITLCLLYYYFY